MKIPTGVPSVIIYRLVGIIGAIVVFFAAASYTWAVYRSGQFYISGELTATPFGGIVFPAAIAVIVLLRVAYVGSWKIWSVTSDEDSDENK